MNTISCLVLFFTHKTWNLPTCSVSFFLLFNFSNFYFYFYFFLLRVWQACAVMQHMGDAWGGTRAPSKATIYYSISVQYSYWLANIYIWHVGCFFWLLCNTIYIKLISIDYISHEPNSRSDEDSGSWIQLKKLRNFGLKPNSCVSWLLNHITLFF